MSSSTTVTRQCMVALQPRASEDAGGEAEPILECVEETVTSLRELTSHKLHENEALSCLGNVSAIRVVKVRVTGKQVIQRMNKLHGMVSDFNAVFFPGDKGEWNDFQRVKKKSQCMKLDLTLEFEYDLYLKIVGAMSLCDVFPYVRSSQDLILLAAPESDPSIQTLDAMERFILVRIKYGDSIYFEMTVEAYTLIEKIFQLETALYLLKGQGELGNLVAIGVIVSGSRSDFLRIGEHLREKFSSFGKEHKARDFAL
eukprot:176659-Hanusia_phi.AAC.1